MTPHSNRSKTKTPRSGPRPSPPSSAPALETRPRHLGLGRRPSNLGRLQRALPSHAPPRFSSSCSPHRPPLVAAIPAATIVARKTGRKDPQIVVTDEVAGQWITLLAAPAHWEYALICLVLFRLFDITKPSPIRNSNACPKAGASCSTTSEQGSTRSSACS